MNGEKSKDICGQLLRAESEAEVTKIISKVAEMQDPKNWNPLDDRETNFNVMSNQASDGGKALTELMTNMVDAVLMKGAYEEGINLRGKEAPQTMYDAVIRFIKVLKDGKLTYLGNNDPWLKEFAKKNLVIGVTGAKNLSEGSPCYTFVDNGEGQSADNFENTFLSLSAGNKKSIPFVQGKYNMGSSGVLGYCGTCWYKLIISRRYDGKSPWAWTLMRRRPDETREAMPIAEYFILKSSNEIKEIPSFDDAPIHPFRTGSKEIYDEIELKTGTIIKLYDYHIGARFIDFKGAREALNENLMETVLPFRIFDFRQKPNPSRGGDRAKGIDVRPFYGMEFSLLRTSENEEAANDGDDTYAEEKKLHIATINDEKLGSISIDAIVIKDDLPSWLKTGSSINRIFHTVNGQVQYKQTRGYLSQQCKFPSLKDKIIIIVNASNLKFGTHNDVWKGDRENIRNTPIGELYLEKVTEKIKQSKSLKALSEKIANDELKDFAQVQANKMLEKLIKLDNTFVDFLVGDEPNIKIPDASKSTGEGSAKGVWDGGRYSPTFVSTEKKSTRSKIPINKQALIVAVTDAENDYLNRDRDRGAVLVNESIYENFSISKELHNGRLFLSIEPRMNRAKVGKVYKFKVGLFDAAMSAVVETDEELVIEIIEEALEDKKSKADKQQKHPKGPNIEEILKGSMPVFEILTRDGSVVPLIDDGTFSFGKWPNGFDELDGGITTDLDDKRKKYGINYDNKFLLASLKRAKKEKVEEKRMTLKYIYTMLFFMIGFDHSLKKETDQKIHDVGDLIMRLAARSMAKSALIISDSIPHLLNKQNFTIGDDDE